MKYTIIKAFFAPSKGSTCAQMTGLVVLSFFIFCAACTRQNKPPAEKATQNSPTDIDPYFVASDMAIATTGPQSITRNIMQDKAGNIWLATWQGIIRYDGDSFSNFTMLEGLRRYHVFSVLAASNGDLWFGTIGAGAYRYDGHTFTNYTPKEGLAGQMVECMVEDKAGNIWFGTDNGAFRFDGKTFTGFTTEQGLPNNSIHSMVVGRNGTLWLGTQGGVCSFNGSVFAPLLKKDGAPLTNVRSIIEDHAGNLWIGGQNGLFRYDGEKYTDIISNFTGYLFEDRSGNIWVSVGMPNTHYMALNRLDAATLQGGMVSVNEIARKETENDAQVFGIFEDNDGFIWFGTMNGACRYDGKAISCFTE